MTNTGSFREVFRFEVEYRLRQPSTWVYAAILLGVPFLMMHLINGSSQQMNAPEPVMNISAVLGGIGMLVSAGMFGDAAARDVSSRMHALFYTSPLGEAHYVLGRFLGAATVNALLLLGVPIGLLVASVMPYMDAGMFGPVQPAAYVQAYLLMLLPNLVLIGACMFAAAVLARHSLATYAGGIALWALSLVAGDFTDGVTNRTLAALADPFGGTAIATVTRYWTPAERNARQIGWPEIMLWNRAIWLSVATLVMLFAAWRFRFVHPVRVPRRRGFRRWWQRWSRRGTMDDTTNNSINDAVNDAVNDTASERLSPLAGATQQVATDARSFSPTARVRQTMAVASRAWRDIAATKAFLTMLVGALLLVFAVGWDVGTERFGTSTWPVAQLIAGTVLSTVIAPVMTVLIAIMAGELVWRERDVGLGDIVDAAPVSDGVTFVGRFLALVGMLVVLQVVLAGAGMLLQTVRDYHRHEPLVFLELLFGVKLVDYLLFAALALTVHVLVNNKYVGHLVVVLCYAFTISAGSLGIRHRLLVYGADPGWVWSDFNGLAPFVQGLVWLKLYWASWALLLAVLASLFWTRGRSLAFGTRVTLARQRLRGGLQRTAVMAVALIFLLGGFVFYNTNVLNAYTTPAAGAARSAYFERSYKRYEKASQPRLVAARMRVELYPASRAAELRGTFHFVNRTARPIDSLHVMVNTGVETRVVSFDRPARAALDDSTVGYRIYLLERPIAPGDSLVMTFDVGVHPRGFRNSGAPTDVSANGTYIDRSWLPLFGYQPGREVTDEKVRREQGLPPREAPPTAGDVEARAAEGNDVELVTADVIIGTDSAQTAIAPGTLMREWREHGRHYFQYRSDQPVRFGGTVLSAKYAVRETTWQDIPLQVFHHPTHDVNVDRMLRSMRASLAYYTANFGPYQFRQLRVVEFPQYANFARAHPGTIAFSEGSAFLTRIDSGEVDRTFFVVAHETAHQWWGGQVIPFGGPGAPMVSETLAQYSSMMVLEAEYGPAMARRFYDYNMDEYLRGRRVFTNREVPLLDVLRQNYVYYYKGAVAMYTLRERLGAAAVNGALRRFLEAYAGPDAPAATSRALYAELKVATPDSLHPLLSDLFEHITLWNVRTDSVSTTPGGAGGWRVTMYVNAAKARADSIGRQTPIPMDEPVEIGVFSDDSVGADGLGKQLYLQQHRIRSGQQTITVTVPTRPARAGIDPYRKFIERSRDDNVKSLVKSSQEGEGGL